MIFGDTQEHWIKSLLKTFGREEMKVVQVGAWDGHETEQMAQIVSAFNGKLIVIDWFKGQISIDDENDIFYTEDEQVIKQRIKTFWSHINPKHHDVIDLRIGDSKELIPQIEDNSVDFFHIDGAHEYEEVKRDISLAFPKVKLNGFICGDDYSGDYEYLKINKLTDEQLSQDTILVPGYGHDTDGNITPHVHAGVVKAVWEFFFGDVMYNLPQNKWCHVKGHTLTGNLGAFKGGKKFEGEDWDWDKDDPHKKL